MLAFSVFGADMREPAISNPESRIRDWRFTENDILTGDFHSAES